VTKREGGGGGRNGGGGVGGGGGGGGGGGIFDEGNYGVGIAGDGAFNSHFGMRQTPMRGMGGMDVRQGSEMAGQNGGIAKTINSPHDSRFM